MIGKNTPPAVGAALAAVTIVLAMVLGSIGCDALSGDAQNPGGTGTVAAKLSRMAAEARDAALAGKSPSTCSRGPMAGPRLSTGSSVRLARPNFFCGNSAS